MHPQKLSNVLALSPQERYGYFVRTAAEFKEVWGLRQSDGGWKVSENPEGQTVYPFWPEREFAEVVATDGWEDARPAMIPLEHFLQRWLPGIQMENAMVGVFWVPPDLTGIDVEAHVLADDLRAELQSFGRL